MALSHFTRTLARENDANNPTSPYTFSHNNADGGKIFVSVSYIASAASTLSATYNGTAMSIAKDIHGGGSGSSRAHAVLFYLDSPTTGSNDVVLTWSSGLLDFVAHAWQVTGAKATSPIGATAGTTPVGSTDADIPITTTEATSEVIVVATQRDGTAETLTEGIGSVQLEEVYTKVSPPGFATDCSQWLGYEIPGSVTTVDVGGTWSATGRLATVAAEVLVAAASSGNPLAGSLGLTGMGW